jgi:hypothetical protein
VALAADHAAHFLPFRYGGAVDAAHPGRRDDADTRRLYGAGPQRRFAACAGMALLLAALGIYGVTASWVNQGRQEIGIRLALVANGGDVVHLALMHGARLTLWGVLAGVAVALPLSRVLRTRLYGATFSVR